MSRIASVFGQRDRKALIPYVTVGYPTPQATLEVVPLLAKNGADIVELGIPFSDPLADGVTIQRSSFRALQNGVTPRLCLDIARQLREKVDIPLVLMTYYNPVFHYGLDEFAKDSAAAGIDGLIIPDLPPEEGGSLEKVTKKRDIDLIYLLAPTTPAERIRWRRSPAALSTWSRSPGSLAPATACPLT
jgi:tryptophan synthase alpha chain